MLAACHSKEGDACGRGTSLWCISPGASSQRHHLAFPAPLLHSVLQKVLRKHDTLVPSQPCWAFYKVGAFRGVGG